MPYQFRYGNPYGASVGNAVYAGLQSQINFARVMQNNQVRLAQRRLDLEQARLVADQKYREAALLTQVREQAIQTAQRNAEFHTQAQQWQQQFAQRGAEARARETADARALELRKQADELRLAEARRAEVNKIRAAGGIPFSGSGASKRSGRGGRGAVPDGFYLHQDGSGNQWLVPQASRESLAYTPKSKAVMTDIKGKMVGIRKDLDRAMSQAATLQKQIESVQLSAGPAGVLMPEQEKRVQSLQAALDNILQGQTEKQAELRRLELMLAQVRNEVPGYDPLATSLIAPPAARPKKITAADYIQRLFGR